MFADMIPAPFIDKFTAFLAWLAERLAEIRERNALRDQAALDQAVLEQAAREQAILREQAAHDRAALREPARDDQAERDQDPAMGALPAADPALAGPDAPDGPQGLLPGARLRCPPAILVPYGRTNAATVAAGSPGARSKHISMTDIPALWCLARPRWAEHAAGSARLRETAPVGWDANSRLEPVRSTHARIVTISNLMASAAAHIRQRLGPAA
jgi:hypothetical protein